METKISVLGVRNDEQAISAHLAMKGYEVKLYECPKFKVHIQRIKKKAEVR